MKINKKFVLSICLLFALLGCSTTVFAQGNSGADFWKKVKHPENQINSGEALDLMMKPGQKQKVNVEIINYDDKEITVSSKIAGARTNSNGGLEYGPNTFPKDKTMKYDLPDLVKIPPNVKVPAKSSTDLVLDITMPEVPYEGIVTGGIQLMDGASSVETKDENGATITNKFAYLFGVTLRMSKDDVAPDFKFRKVGAGLQNYRNSIIVKVANVKPMVAKNMIMDVEITEKGKKDVLYQKKKNEMSLAPHTVLAFPISMDGDRMRAGEYTAHIVLKGYDKEWKWKKDFTITDEEADKFNNEDPYLVQERGLDWKLIGLIVAGVVGVVTVITIVLKVTKNKSGKKKSKKKKSPKKK